jgi:hypothetical protein
MTDAGADSIVLRHLRRQAEKLDRLLDDGHSLDGLIAAFAASPAGTCRRSGRLAIWAERNERRPDLVEQH